MKTTIYKGRKYKKSGNIWYVQLSSRGWGGCAMSDKNFLARGCVIKEEVRKR